MKSPSLVLLPPLLVRHLAAQCATLLSMGPISFCAAEKNAVSILTAAVSHQVDW